MSRREDDKRRQLFQDVGPTERKKTLKMKEVGKLMKSVPLESYRHWDLGRGKK